jgi:hypothetical protein
MKNVGIFYDHLKYFTEFWYIFPRFGISYQEKSGDRRANRPSINDIGDASPRDSAATPVPEHK